MQDDYNIIITRLLLQHNDDYNNYYHYNDHSDYDDYNNYKITITTL